MAQPEKCGVSQTAGTGADVLLFTSLAGGQFCFTVRSV